MVDPFFPETGSVFLAGSNYTFDVQSYTEEGGERRRTFIRTMGRNYRRFEDPITDIGVNFDLTLTGSGFADLYSKTVGSIGSVSLDFNGSYTIDYFNMYSINLIHSSNAGEYLIGKMSFKCTPYDSNGSKNKVIT